MNLDEAIKLVKKAVKPTGTIEQKHIDLTLVPTDERAIYEKALAHIQLAVSQGTIAKDELQRRLTLDH